MLSSCEREELKLLIEKLLQKIPDYGDELTTYAEELRWKSRKFGRQEGK